jgi:nitrite reductase (NO-forming)
MSTRTAASPSRPDPAGSARAARGVAVGLALVLVAVLAGMTGDRLAGPGGGGAAPATAAGVTPTGNTVTVDVVADGMRFFPDQVEVEPGDRLVINLTNADQRRHDLVLDNGAHTPPIGQGATATLDAGVISGSMDGWCSLPGHRQQGMVFTVTTTGDAGRPGGDAAGGHHHHGGAAPGGPARVDPMADPGEAFTPFDAVLAPADPDTTVHRHTFRIQELELEVAPGVTQTVWTFNGTAPGPVLRGRVGDVFEIQLINDGTVDHGIDFHAGALAPDGPMRPIDPGEELLYRFTATHAGVWMYHCSTMPMLHHIGNGMYGVVIIDPPDLPPVDREYVLVQSEFYLGPAGEIGDLAKMQAETPDAVVFNGYVSQYAHRPLPATTGDRVRIWVLNAGPSRWSAFHVVGGLFDTVYREGRFELTPGDSGGAQVLDLAPAAGGFVETVFPEAGHYPFVSHSMVDAERGARGVFRVSG